MENNTHLGQGDIVNRDKIVIEHYISPELMRTIFFLKIVYFCRS